MQIKTGGAKKHGLILTNFFLKPFPNTTDSTWTRYVSLWKGAEKSRMLRTRLTVSNTHSCEISHRKESFSPSSVLVITTTDNRLPAQVIKG